MPILLFHTGKKVNESHYRFGWPEDVWFHVDKLSSAHVYLRLPQGMNIHTIPQELVCEEGRGLER